MLFCSFFKRDINSNRTNSYSNFFKRIFKNFLNRETNRVIILKNQTNIQIARKMMQNDGRKERWMKNSSVVTQIKQFNLPSNVSIPLTARRQMRHDFRQKIQTSPVIYSPLKRPWWWRFFHVQTAARVCERAARRPQKTACSRVIEKYHALSTALCFDWKGRNSPLYTLQRDETGKRETS